MAPKLLVDIRDFECEEGHERVRKVSRIHMRRKRAQDLGLHALEQIKPE